jgi:hypothetical protein
LGIDTVFTVSAAGSTTNGMNERTVNVRVVVIKRFMAGGSML